MKNKEADLLHNYWAADRRLCFHMQKVDFLMTWLNINPIKDSSYIVRCTGQKNDVKASQAI